MDTNNTPNIETKIAARSKSVFASFGQIVSDFYLEAGIYFVGGFNAALVAWDLYTTLTADTQPLLYAVAIAIIAFIAVEGLAVYLVGAAAKTNNWLLWTFSVIFASFFTYAHYQEMTGRGGVIAEYITLAIPFFVVVGYWARTVKVDAEINEAETFNEAKSERERQRAIEDENRERRHRIEDENRQRNQDAEAQKLAHKLEMNRVNLEGQQAQKMAEIEVKTAKMNHMDGSKGSFDPANKAITNKKMNRQNDLIELVKVEPGMGPTELVKRLNELGHSTSISTVKRDIKALNGSLVNSKFITLQS